MSVAAQMNIRIDPSLKERGDKILAKHGLTPSQGVRAFYEAIAGTKKQSKQLFDVISNKDSEQFSEDEEKQKKLESIREIQEHIRELGSKNGTAHSKMSASTVSDKDLLEEAIFEHYSQKEMIL